MCLNIGKPDVTCVNIGKAKCDMCLNIGKARCDMCLNIGKARCDMCQYW